MLNQKNENKNKSRRKGVWEEVERLQDPASKVTLVLSERIRGKHAYSIQICMEDEMGLNKHIDLRPENAKHDLKHIVYSLVEAAEAVVRKQNKVS